VATVAIGGAENAACWPRRSLRLAIPRWTKAVTAEREARVAKVLEADAKCARSGRDVACSSTDDYSRREVVAYPTENLLRPGRRRAQ